MKKGFTLIEMLVVVAVVATLLSITTFNLLSYQEKSYIDSTVETVMSDIKAQQLKSMSGDTGGGSTLQPFGVKFNSNSYVLFTGSTYSSTNSSNFTIAIDNSLAFNPVTFPQTQIIFTKGSGEIQGFTSPNNTITIRHTASGLQKTITINRYGVITSVQ